MSALLTVPPFDYGSVPAVETAALRAQAERIRKSNRSVMATILQIGGELLDVKARLPHGQFGLWVEAECELAARTAEQYMSVAKLAEGKTATVAHLTPTLAYQLAAKSAAPEIVNEVLERAGKGEVIDQREVADELLNARNQKKYEAEKKAKRDSRSTEAISRREAEEERREEEARQVREREKKAAYAIIARLGTESVQFLLEQLGDRSWSVVALLREETSRIRAKAQETQSPAPPSIATAPSADMPDIPALFDRRLQQAKAEGA